MKTEPAKKKASAWLTSPIKIAAAYMLIGGLWISFVHRGLAFLFNDQTAHAILDLFEGWFFLSVTALILYWLVDRDMAAIRRSQEELKESQRTLATLLSNLPGLAYRCRNDRDWTMEFVSEGCSVLTGYHAHDLINNSRISYAQLIHPDDQKMVWSQVQEALQENRPFQLTYRIITAGGAVKWVWEQGRQVPSPAGGMPALEGFITDITAHRLAMDELQKHRDHLEELVKARTLALEAAQKTLVQREKLKTLGVIAAEVAHEIRNPLAAIGGFARRLYKKNPELTESQIILRETLRLEKILDRITNYLQPVTVSPAPCNINDIVAEGVNLLAPEIAGRSMHSQLQLEQDMPFIYSDPDILMQVFLNIMQSGIDTMQAGDALAVKTFSDGQNLYIEFRSPAAEQTPKDPELLFLPFEEGGESIGLPLAYRLVKDMGGVLSFAREDST
ncbi:MAG: PAS domain-containing protein, partial [Proteobacteria bacterium]|nr:PAS domain-containing protein [Pseudomonadota bacterium]